MAEGVAESRDIEVFPFCFFGGKSGEREKLLVGLKEPEGGLEEAGLVSRLRDVLQVGEAKTRTDGEEDSAVCSVDLGLGGIED